MYYLRQRTNVSGPFTAEQIKGMLHRGRVARSDKVSTDRASWQAIGSAREIIDLLHPAEPFADEEADVVEVVEEPVDNRVWYFTMGGAQQEESIDTQRLRRLIETRRVFVTDLVWMQGFTDWQPVATIPELAAYAADASRNDSGDSPRGGDDNLGPIPNLRPVNRRRRKKGWF